MTTVQTGLYTYRQLMLSQEMEGNKCAALMSNPYE